MHLEARARGRGRALPCSRRRRTASRSGSHAPRPGTRARRRVSARPEPGALTVAGRRRSRRSHRARIVAGSHRAPSSSRSPARPGPRRTRGGSPADRTRAPPCGVGQRRVDPAALVRVIREGAVVHPEPVGVVLAGDEGPDRRCRRATSATRPSGSGTRIWNCSLNRRKPAAVEASVEVRRRRR